MKKTTDLENEQRVPCPECEGDGSGGDWDWDEDTWSDCSLCDGEGTIPKSVRDSVVAKQKAEERERKLPTEEERALADYLGTILPISLDQADTVVQMLVTAVEHRRAHERAMREYEG